MPKRQVTFSDELRRAILDAPMSRFAIWKATGIDQAVLSRFVNGKVGMTLETLDKVAALLDLHVTSGGKVRATARKKRQVKRGQHRR